VAIKKWIENIIDLIVGRPMTPGFIPIKQGCQTGGPFEVLL